MKVAGGSGFARLWGASAVSNLGDGVYATALPLLAASLTRDPLLVSVVSLPSGCRGCCSGCSQGPCSTAGTGGG
jgi:hypothetical protein